MKNVTLKKTQLHQEHENILPNFTSQNQIFLIRTIGSATGMAMKLLTHASPS